MNWMILDGNEIAYRTLYWQGTLVEDVTNTGFIFGFLRDIQLLQRLLPGREPVFCFDYGKQLKRREIYPAYKANRDKREQELTEEEKITKTEMRRQVRLLMAEILPSIGYNNVFYQNGYEGDDMIASVISSLPSNHTAMVISEDKDMYQLLSKNVMIYHMRKKSVFSHVDFRHLYKISPSKWSMVKALSGCSSDNVKGIPGIGEATALKYLREELKTSSQAYKKILNGRHIWERNLQLVSLPFPGVDRPVLAPNEVSTAKWNEVCKEYNCRSLINSGEFRRETPGFGIMGRKRNEIV